MWERNSNEKADCLLNDTSVLFCLKDAPNSRVYFHNLNDFMKFLQSEVFLWEKSLTLDDTFFNC